LVGLSYFKRGIDDRLLSCSQEYAAFPGLKARKTDVQLVLPGLNRRKDERADVIRRRFKSISSLDTGQDYACVREDSPRRICDCPLDLADSGLRNQE
jgi:hypothetical protein